jgi:hypothetical protein
MSDTLFRQKQTFQHTVQEATVNPPIDSMSVDVDATTGGPKDGIHHHHQEHQARRLFTNLNREKSDEGYDLFRHSDKSPPSVENLSTMAPHVSPTAPPPQAQARTTGAGVKRRREDDEKVEKTSITTRATRKQRLSNSNNGGNASSGADGAEAKTNARGIKRLGVNGEGASGAIAKYKAQRNKQR